MLPFSHAYVPQPWSSLGHESARILVCCTVPRAHIVLHLWLEDQKDEQIHIIDVAWNCTIEKRI